MRFSSARNRAWSNASTARKAADESIIPDTAKESRSGRGPRHTSGTATNGRLIPMDVKAGRRRAVRQMDRHQFKTDSIGSLAMKECEIFGVVDESAATA